MKKNRKKVKIAFLGSRPISLKALEIVNEFINKFGEDWIDLSVFTKSDDSPPIGVVDWWNLGSLRKEVNKIHFNLLSSEETLRSTYFDLITMVFHNDIIPPDIIKKVPRGITNIHFGYLPEIKYSLQKGSRKYETGACSIGTYRGSNILTHAILKKEEWQAITFHFISDKIDLGPIIEYAWNPISIETTAWDLQIASEKKGIAMYKKYFPILVNNHNSIKTLLPGEEKYPYYNRYSLENLKILDSKIKDKELELVTRAFAFPNTEPAYFLEKKGGESLKRYVYYTKKRGVTILKPQETIYLQKVEDLTI